MNLTISNNINTPTFWDVTRDNIQTFAGFQRMVILPVIRAFAWAEYFGATLSKTARIFQKTFRHTNHFFFWLRYPGENFPAFINAVSNLKNSLKSGSFLEMGDCSLRVYALGIFTVDIFADFAKILHKENLITLTGRALVIVNYIGFLSSTAMAIIGVMGMKDRIQDLRQYDYNTPLFNLNLIRLTNRVSLAAIGVFGVMTFTGVATVPMLATLIAATVLLITAIATEFYSKLVVAKSGQ